MNDRINAAKQALSKLPPPQETGLRADVKALRDDIEKSLAAGHSLTSIASALTSSGIAISPRTLARYLKDARGASKRRRTDGATS